jgi:hypothetical protein
VNAGRVTTTVITLGTCAHPLGVSARPVFGAPGFVSITLTCHKELIAVAMVTLAAIKEALVRCEAEAAYLEELRAKEPTPQAPPRSRAAGRGRGPSPGSGHVRRVTGAP